jgi:hypothetical protein
MRLGGPSGRAKVGRAALLLSAACAFFEAFRQAMYFEGQGWVLVPGWPSRLLICATLAGFTMILILGIAAMERWGFGSALSIWLLWYAFLDVGPHVAFFHWDRETFVVVAKIVLVAAIASWIVRASAKPAGADGRSSLALPVLASGTAPVIFVATLLTLPPVPKAYFHALDELLPRLPDIGPRTVLALELGAASLATVVLSRLFQAPRRVTRVIARAEALKGRHDVDLVTIKAQASRLLWVTTAKSLLFIVMAELLLLTSPRAPQAWFNAIWFWPFIGPAIAFDLFDEWRARRRHPDLVSVWPEHRPYAAHAARTILEQANIVVLLRGLHHRTCLQFFGPYVPVDIMVPAAYAEQALSLLNGVLDERFGSPVADTIAVSPRSR